MAVELLRDDFIRESYPAPLPSALFPWAVITDASADELVAIESGYLAFGSGVQTHRVRAVWEDGLGGLQAVGQTDWYGEWAIYNLTFTPYAPYVINFILAAEKIGGGLDGLTGYQARLGLNSATGNWELRLDRLDRYGGVVVPATIGAAVEVDLSSLAGLRVTVTDGHVIAAINGVVIHNVEDATYTPVGIAMEFGSSGGYMGHLTLESVVAVGLNDDPEPDPSPWVVDPVARPWSLSAEGFDPAAPDRLPPDVEDRVLASTVTQIASLLGSAHRGIAENPQTIHSYRLFVVEDRNGDRVIDAADDVQQDGGTAGELGVLVSQTIGGDAIGWNVEEPGGDDDLAGEANLLAVGDVIANLVPGRAYFVVAHVCYIGADGQLYQNWPAAALSAGEVLVESPINLDGLTVDGLPRLGIPARAVAWFRVNKIEWAK